MNSYRGVIVGAAALALLMGPAARTEETSDEAATAVMCPKCEVVWVKSAHPTGKTTIYVSTKKMTCDDCKSAVENFFTTGKFEHSCKHCGDLVACEKVQEAIGEPAPAKEAEKGHDAAHQHHLTHPMDK